MRLYAALTLLSAWQHTVLAASADDWRSRSIYQVMTDRYGRLDGSTTAKCDAASGVYCGGTWQGIINNLDYIQNMGFTAIWISPITANLPQCTVDLCAYHGYWQQNMNALNDNFGTEADLQALSKALHDRGMYLMVDVVVNHFAWAGDHTTVQYDRLIPFNNQSYYHPYCDINNVNASTTQCWLGDSVITLPDLRTEDQDVASMFQPWISKLVSTYNVDGLRLDSAGNVDKEFFINFTKAATVFTTGEINSGVPAYTCPYQTTLDSVLNYPIYFPLVRAFQNSSGNMMDLVDALNLVKSTCKDVNLMGTFSENHDQPRFASYTDDINLAKNILVYTMLADGIPIIYQGQEQHYSGAHNPVNREAVWLSGYDKQSPLYTFTTILNVFRTQAIKTSNNYIAYNSRVIYNDSNTIAMRKGFDGSQVVTVLTNDGILGASRTITLQNGNNTGFWVGDVVTDIISCTNSTVDDKGDVTVTIKGGMPGVFYLASHLVGTTICFNGTTVNPNIVNMDPPHKNGARKSSQLSEHAIFWTLIVSAALGFARWL